MSPRAPTRMATGDRFSPPAGESRGQSVGKEPLGACGRLLFVRTEKWRNPCNSKGFGVSGGGSVGAREENRTPDLLFTRQLLCRLSYSGGLTRVTTRKALRIVGDADGGRNLRVRHG